MASDVIRIDYKIPSDRIVPLSLSAIRPVYLAETVDLRKQDPCYVMKKISLSGGPATGNYMSEQPVAEILHKAVSKALEHAGNAKPKGEADFCLSLKIIALDFGVKVGFSQCMLMGNIKVEVSVTEAITGNIVWEGPCEGTGRVGTGPLVQRAFSTALDELLLNLLACPGFK
ncbi:MAG: hypothetical protein JEZ02_13015 [Desulfatibacillum sp.]|nr:hypothetical protein [Desulfatibacillum sp.]